VLDFIESLPGGFDEPVRERGNSLSTGQKQLINFARALAYNPRILILDEATSSVDTDTELRIRGALERMVEGRTSVLIAHRLSTVQRAETILVMHKGQLREMGSHQQLLASAASTGSSTSCSTRTRKRMDLRPLFASPPPRQQFESHRAAQLR
jgi:ATP-binding cassette subfamily B multidrug efflux pump